MKTIYKYSLTFNDTQIIKLPRFALELSVQLQHGKPTLWALVDTEQPEATYFVRCFGTGHEVTDMPIGFQHLGTVLLANDSLVLHFFGWPAPDHTPTPADNRGSISKYSTGP